VLEPDLSRFRATLPPWPLLALIGAGAGFFIINAMLEEFVWCGVFQDWLLSIMSPAWAVAIQALSFGTVHYLGFPGGFAGAALATIYGAMVGALAFSAGGLLAALVAHIAADAVIFTIVAGFL
jgi:membrane protease YdiL (CAAX protease family)